MRVLITGGCGFVGTNLAATLLARGDDVVVLDNLQRAGTELNLAWLRAHPRRARLQIVEGDIRDADEVARVAADTDLIVHLAAQVAVTTSVNDPRDDFEINALGTLNVLEAARAARSRPAVLFASTNKVYGALDDLALSTGERRYRFAACPQGVDEERPLDFYSPYGCSKGAADQYVRDYARIYGLRTVVFRMSCIYGPHQLGNEDQGWIAHFARAAVAGEQVTIYGDGRQTRDVLHVDDAIRAYLAAVERIGAVTGEVFNLGGGAANTLSLLELLDLLECELGRPVAHLFGGWRPGDQRVYISDVGKARRLLGWQPLIAPADGVRALVDWHARRHEEAA